MNNLVSYMIKAVALAASVANAESILPKVKVSGLRYFVDMKTGQSMIFHGHNVVVKVPPYLPTNDGFDVEFSLTDAEIDMMYEWGTNVVRLGVIWEAVETAPGVYDHEYLNRVEQLVERFAKRGIYTIIDSHQDLFSRRLCGEGVPDFYFPPWDQLDHECPHSFTGYLYSAFGNCKPFDSYNIPKDEKTGLPIPEECNKQNFLQLYTTPEIASAFEYFWNNKNGIQDKFFDYWRVLAKKFEGNWNVLGYDVLNEPFAANLYNNSYMFVDQSNFDRNVLSQFYKNAGKAIRSKDSQHMVFLEPNQFPNTIPINGGIIASSGLSKELNSIMDEHLYCCLMEPGICDNGDIPADKLDACKVFHQRKLSARSADAERNGQGLMISEWGACSGSEACYQEMVNVQDVMDAQAASHIYWQFKSFGDFTTVSNFVEGVYNKDGSVQELKEKALTRTYFQKYMGYPIGTHFDNESGDFSAKFRLLEDTKGAKEKTSTNILYMNTKRHYSQGSFMTAVATATGKPVKLSAEQIDANHLKVVLSDFSVGDEVIVTLTPELEYNDGRAVTEDKEINWTIAERENSKEERVFVTIKQGDVPADVSIKVQDRLGNYVAAQADGTVKMLAGDYVNCQIVLVESSYFGLVQKQAKFSVPNLHGHDLTVNVKNLVKTDEL